MSGGMRRKAQTAAILGVSRGHRRFFLRTHADQCGVVLLIALIMLVAMTMAGFALIRSVYTTNIIAGNLAFQQAATHSSDGSIEAAIAWLESNNTGTTLHANHYSNGYAASFQNPGSAQTWDDFWDILISAGQIITQSADAAGNTPAYTIQRLCNAVGDPTSGIGCAASPASVGSAGNSKGVGVVAIRYSSQVYYRITARVAGPRNTVSFVQTVVAM